jgi:outer membrane protein TolC
MRLIHKLYIFASISLFLTGSCPAFAQDPQEPDRKQQISIPQEMISSREELVTKVQEISVYEPEAEEAGDDQAETGHVLQPQDAEEPTTIETAKEAAIPQKPPSTEVKEKKMYWEKNKRVSSRGNFISNFFGALFKEPTSIIIMGSPDRASKNVRKKSQGKYDLEKEIGLVNMGAFPKDAPELLSLNDCIEIATHNHLPLQTAKKSIRLAEMRIAEAKRNMLPTATIDYDEYTGEIYGRRYYGRKQYIEGQQPVFHGGELYYGLKQAETNLEVAKNDYRKQKNELILQVKKAYYTLAKAKENLSVQQVLSRDTDKIYDMVNKQLEANIVSRLEFLNVSSQASQVKYQLISAEGDLSVAELILKQAMNIEPGDKIDIAPIVEFKKVEVNFARALAAAYVNRPEIRINFLMIDYYNFGKGVARAKQSLKVDLLGMWGLSKEEFIGSDVGIKTDGTKDVDTKLEQQWYAGVKTSLPFWGNTAEYSWTREQWTPAVSAYQGTEADTSSWKFKVLDKLDTYSEKQLSEIDYDKARQELIKIKQDVTLEIKEGCFNYEKALVQFETAANKMKFQERDLEFVKLRRSMGEADDSNVIESMIKLAQEKFGYLQALADCHISLATINKSIGQEDFFKDEIEQQT